MPKAKDQVFKNLYRQVMAVGPSSMLLSLSFKDVLMLRPELIAYPEISKEFPIFTMMVHSYPELSKIMGAYPELANWKTSPSIQKKYNRFWTSFKKRAKDAMRSDCVATYGKNCI